MTTDITELLNRGLSRLQAGDWSSAINEFDAVLAKAPSHADALWLKGVAALQLDRVDDAASLLERAHQSRPTDAAICNDLGMALEAGKRLEEASAWFGKAVHLDPDMAHAHVNVARLALDRGDGNAALTAITRALDLDANQSGAHNIKGNVLRELGRADDALAAYEAALLIDPGNIQALLNKGLLLYEQEDSLAAVKVLEDVRDRLDASSTLWADAVMTLGLIKAKARALEEAVGIFDGVLDRHPDHVAARVNRGEVRLRHGNLVGAERDFVDVLALDPNSPEAHLNLGQLRLLQERWSDGWDNYLWRWQSGNFDSKRRDRGLPAWDGNPQQDLGLLVWGEQGLGDQILFASQIKDAVDAGLLINLEVDARLVPLFARNGLENNVFGYNQVPADVLTECQAQCPLGSLGRVFRRNADDFPDPLSYLRADPARVGDLRAAYETLAKGRTVVGLSWHSMNPKFGIEKSLPLDAYAPILQTKDTFFVSLQYGDVQSEVNSVNTSCGTDVYVDGDVDHIVDLDSAAAQIAAMDLVITTSNTTAHLSGALGKETWVMVHKTPEWRWGLERKGSPWYPHVRIFRQQTAGDWSEPVQTVADALSARISA